MTQIISLLQPKEGISPENDAYSVVRAQAHELMVALQRAAAPDSATRMHLLDLHDRLENALKPNP